MKGLICTKPFRKFCLKNYSQVFHPPKDGYRRPIFPKHYPNQLEKIPPIVGAGSAGLSVVAASSVFAGSEVCPTSQRYGQVRTCRKSLHPDPLNIEP